MDGAGEIIVYSDNADLKGSKETYNTANLPEIKIPKNGGYLAIIKPAK